MRKRRFSVEQVVAVLKQAELGLPAADLIRQVGISEQTFYCWRKQYAGLESGLRRKPFSNSVRSTPPGHLGRYRCSKAVTSIAR